MDIEKQEEKEKKENKVKYPLLDIKDGPPWLQNWPGLRFQRRFTLSSPKFNPNDLLICAAPLAYWFDKNWDIFFPQDPRSVPFSTPHNIDRYLYVGYEGRTADELEAFLDKGRSVEDALELIETLQGPYLMTDLYTPTSMDPELHPLHLIREQALETGKQSKYFYQRVLVYELPELSLIQKDYISEFFHLLRDQLLEQQDSALQEGYPNFDLESFDADSFDLRLDKYPLPTNSLLEYHVRTLVLDMQGDKFHLIIGCDAEQSLEHRNAPDEIEVMATVLLDPDDEVRAEDADSTTTLDGESAVAFHLTMRQVL